MLPVVGNTLYSEVSPFVPGKMPRVVPDQREKFENDELFRKLSRESEVSSHPGREFTRKSDLTLGDLGFVLLLVQRDLALLEIRHTHPPDHGSLFFIFSDQIHRMSGSTTG